MKHEWEKQEKEIYGVKTKSCVVGVPAQKYITAFGSGNSNDEVLPDKVAALSSMAYKTKVAYRILTEKSNEMTDYTAYLLEEIRSTVMGVWEKNTVKYT